MVRVTEAHVNLAMFSNMIGGLALGEDGGMRGDWPIHIVGRTGRRAGRAGRGFESSACVIIKRAT